MVDGMATLWHDVRLLSSNAVVGADGLYADGALVPVVVLVALADDERQGLARLVAPGRAVGRSSVGRDGRRGRRRVGETTGRQVRLRGGVRVGCKVGVGRVRLGEWLGRRG